MRLAWLATLYLSIAIALVILLAQLSMLPALRVREVDVVGTHATDRQDIFEVAARELSGRYLHLFPRGNIFLFSRNRIERAILEAFPRIRTADVGLARGSRIEVRVTEREAVGVVCSPSARAALGELCFFLDERGFAFAPAPVFTGDALYFTYREESARRFAVGSYVLTPRLFAEAAGVRRALEDVGLSPVALTVSDADADAFARHLTFTLEEGTDLIFSDEAALIPTELENFRSILVSEGFAEESGGDIGTIEYIDLRFGNKVFYRLERGESEG